MKNDLTLFTGARWDNNTYSIGLLSPRLALVYRTSETDSHKFIWSRSTRNPPAEQLALLRQKGEDVDKIETLKSLEYIYFGSHDVLDQDVTHDYSLSTYLNTLDAVTFSSGGLSNSGIQKIAGLELDYSYNAQRYSISLGYAYTDLLDFNTQGIVANEDQQVQYLLCDEFRVQAVTVTPVVTTPIWPTGHSIR